MSAEIEEHIAAAETFYRPIILGPSSRLKGGAKLRREYQKGRKAYRRGATDFLPVYERINEMAAAHVLLSDPRCTLRPSPMRCRSQHGSIDLWFWVKPF